MFIYLFIYFFFFLEVSLPCWVCCHLFFSILFSLFISSCGFFAYYVHAYCKWKFPDGLNHWLWRVCACVYASTGQYQRGKVQRWIKRKKKKNYYYYPANARPSINEKLSYSYRPPLMLLLLVLFAQLVDKNFHGYFELVILVSFFFFLTKKTNRFALAKLGGRVDVVRQNPPKQN